MDKNKEFESNYINAVIKDENTKEVKLINIKDFQGKKVLVGCKYSGCNYKELVRLKNLFVFSHRKDSSYKSPIHFCEIKFTCDTTGKHKCKSRDRLIRYLPGSNPKYEFDVVSGILYLNKTKPLRVNWRFS